MTECAEIFRTADNVIRDSVESLRRVRRQERELSCNLKAVSKARDYMNATGNALPLLAAMYSTPKDARRRNSAKVLEKFAFNGELPDDNDARWSVPDDWKAEGK